MVSEISSLLLNEQGGYVPGVLNFRSALSNASCHKDK